MDAVVFENTGLPDIVELRGISQRYGKKTVIENLNLLIENKPGQGQFFTILGASGCGKSTLLRFIAGLQIPTEGQVFLYEKPLVNEDTQKTSNKK
jgi:NitT/TauT family transport system ATP-binding protein